MPSRHDDIVLPVLSFSQPRCLVRHFPLLYFPLPLRMFGLFTAEIEPTRFDCTASEQQRNEADCGRVYPIDIDSHNHVCTRIVYSA